MITKNKKKAFTLIEMIVVIIIIGILMGVLMPKISSFINKTKDKANLIAARNYLMLQVATDTSYPIHIGSVSGKSFSKKPYLVEKDINGGDTTSLYKDMVDKWGGGSWAMIYDTKAAIDDDASNSSKFLNGVLSKLSAKDMKGLKWNDNAVVSIGFFGHMGNLIAGASNEAELKTKLKDEGYEYIEKKSTEISKAKWNYGGFVLWLDKTAGNGGVKIGDTDLINDNPELKDGYVNMMIVSDEVVGLSDLFDEESLKRGYVTNVLKAMKGKGIQISSLTAGN